MDESFTSNHFDPAVLIIGYRRHESVLEILQICMANNVSRIYIAVDGPKKDSIQGKSDQKKLVSNAKNFEKVFKGELIINHRQDNIGCAASVLTACEWVFERENAVIILEDDCIPSDDFFRFSRNALPVIQSQSDIWLACGTQFSPKFTETDSWLLSRYALTWGWCTTKDKWSEIAAALHHPIPIATGILSLWEKTYWNQGSRRAQVGWVDVWDTILVQQMQARSKFAVLPEVTLVTNIGNDLSATHTHGNSRWLNLQVGKFSMPQTEPRYELKVDSWLQKYFFEIAKRHLVSTQITRVRDFVRRDLMPFRPLSDRWSAKNG